ncbi:MAG: low molecular weight protein arginine phosphatase [Clostridia bacterium]|nr:low molecular weight protein arginine phosphatase [Clostridia bacterium]
MKILFVCTGNTCRSPMAASFLPDTVSESAGTHALPGDEATAEAIRAASQAGGRSLENHRARRLDSVALELFDYILTMNVQQKHWVILRYPQLADKIFTIGEKAGEPQVEIPDPYGLSQAVYDQTALLLKHLIRKIVPDATKTSGPV